LKEDGGGCGGDDDDNDSVFRFSPSLVWLIGDHNRFIAQKRSMSTAVSLIGNSLNQKAIYVQRQGGK
jgi:hypothetical protein